MIKEYKYVPELDLTLNRTVDPKDAVLFEDDSMYYGDDDYLTNSKLGYMKQNVHEFYSYLLGDHTYPSNQNFVFGRWVHVLCLEPEKASMFNVVPKTNSEYARKNKGFSEAVKEFGYDWTITEYEFNMGKSMAESYFRTDGIRELLERASLEKAHVGFDPFGYGIPMKGKLDIEDRNDPDYAGSLVVSDIKTTKTQVDKFTQAIRSFDYLRPAALYMHLSGADAFKFHPIHKGGGHAVAEFVVERDSASFKKGMFMLEELVEKFHRLYVEGNYSPTYLYSVKLP